jgi:pimeloyl-ACP methyl ester carboxylesterase
MLHGDILNAEIFLPQVTAFQSGYRLIIPERRGHGRTPDLAEEYTYDLFAKDTIAFMDALSLSRAILLGHSGGADMALMIAVSRPDLVSKLVVVSGESSIELTEERKAKVLSQSADEFRGFGPMVVDAYERVTPDGIRRFPLFFEKIKRLWATSWRITDEKLGSISAETLVMVGDHDFGSVEEAATLSRKIPRAQLCVVPGAGHGLMWQKPQIVNNVILNFLNDETRHQNRPGSIAPPP